MKHALMASLEAKLGYQFLRRELLEQALTHSSHAREQLEAAPDNEQLEFLGDAVLGFVTSQELFERFPEYDEGELSKLRAHLVSARHLVDVANEIGLGEYLRLGRGEEKTGGRAKGALLSDALEAVVAALYLDAGIDIARAFILETIVRPELGRIDPATDELLLADYKSRLQETLHAMGRPQPEYVQAGAVGPEHKKTFTMEVRVFAPAGEVEFTAIGDGASLKQAGQAAAQRALARLKTLSPDKDID